MTEITEDILKKVIKKRASDSYKGKYGRVLLIGGSENYGGAIIMSTEGAVNAGAGLVATATHPLICQLYMLVCQRQCSLTGAIAS